MQPPFGNPLAQRCRSAGGRAFWTGPCRGWLTFSWWVIPVLSSALAHAEPGAISFRNDVMAVISKAGCNAGTCHGNKNGKGGFKLSLRGQDPEADYVTLTRDLFSLRVNPLEPEQSLVLLKPTTQVSHQGGLRFEKNSREYQLVRAWLAAGMPSDLATAPKLVRLSVTPTETVLLEPANKVQLKAQAFFSDGSTRDVTSLAVYDPANNVARVSHDGLVEEERAGEATVLVRYLQCQQAVRVAFVPARPNFVWEKPKPKNYIDERIFAKLRTLRMNPSALCSDEIFLRRAYLDLLGILPTREGARAVVNPSPRNGRRKEAPPSKAGIQNTQPEVVSIPPRLAATGRETQIKRTQLID